MCSYIETIVAIVSLVDDAAHEFAPHPIPRTLPFQAKCIREAGWLTKREVETRSALSVPTALVRGECADRDTSGDEHRYAVMGWPISLAGNESQAARDRTSSVE